MGTVGILFSLSSVISLLGVSASTFGAIKACTVKIAKFFHYSTIFCNLFNCISCVCTTIHFIIATKEINMNIFAIAAIATWYIGKIILFWLLSIRIEKIFKHTEHRMNYNIIKCFNILILTLPLISLFGIKWFVITEYVFIVFSSIYVILLCWIQIQFNKRLRRVMSKFEVPFNNQPYEQVIDQDGCTHDMCELFRNGQYGNIEADQHKISTLNRYLFFHLTKQGTLCTWITVSMIIFAVIMVLYGFGFVSIFHILTIMSVDSLIDIVCLLFMFKYCELYYNKICRNGFKCDYICSMLYDRKLEKPANAENQIPQLSVDIKDAMYGVDLVVNGLIRELWKSEKFRVIRLPSEHAIAVIKLYSKPCEIWDELFQTMNENTFWIM